MKNVYVEYAEECAIVIRLAQLVKYARIEYAKLDAEVIPRVNLSKPVLMVDVKVSFTTLFYKIYYD